MMTGKNKKITDSIVEPTICIPKITWLWNLYREAMGLSSSHLVFANIHPETGT